MPLARDEGKLKLLDNFKNNFNFHQVYTHTYRTTVPGKNKSSRYKVQPFVKYIIYGTKINSSKCFDHLFVDNHGF